MLKPENAFVLVVDVQGKLAEIVRKPDRLKRNVARLIEAARLFDLPLVVTEQVPEKLGATAPDLVEVLGDHPRLSKVTFSCWGDEAIRAAIEGTGAKQAIVCGIESHVCVHQTVMDLLGADYQVHLVKDAVSSRAPDNKEVACARMAFEGAKISSTEMALFELQVHCTGDRFRALSRLVK